MAPSTGPRTAPAIDARAVIPISSPRRSGEPKPTNQAVALGQATATLMPWVSRESSSAGAVDANAKPTLDAIIRPRPSNTLGLTPRREARTRAGIVPTTIPAPNAAVSRPDCPFESENSSARRGSSGASAVGSELLKKTTAPVTSRTLLTASPGRERGKPVLGDVDPAHKADAVLRQCVFDEIADGGGSGGLTAPSGVDPDGHHPAA